MLWFGGAANRKRDEVVLLCYMRTCNIGWLTRSERELKQFRDAEIAQVHARDEGLCAGEELTAHGALDEFRNRAKRKDRLILFYDHARPHPLEVKRPVIVVTAPAAAFTTSDPSAPADVGVTTR